MVDIKRLIGQGFTHQQAGRYQQAEVIYRRILQADDNQAQVLFLYGTLACATSRAEMATTLLSQAIKQQPNQADYHFNLGYAFQMLGQLEQAYVHFQRATYLAPNDLSNHLTLASTLGDMGQHKAAERHYKKLIVRWPDEASLFHAYGLALRREVKLAEAIMILSRARDLGDVNAHCNYANLLREMGRFDEAEHCYQTILEHFSKHKRTFSSWLFAQASQERSSPADILKAHQAWAARYTSVEMAQRYQWPRAGDNQAERDRPLKIAYVSPDFKKHVVGRLIEPIIQYHQRDNVEVTCYAQLSNPDSMSQCIAQQADHWRNIEGKTDEVVADLIQRDGIDILIDLSGHSSGNRLTLFALRPAPIQVTYMGYCNTTGLDTMDYWVTDTDLHPVDTIEQSVEEIVRLPRCWLSYHPQDETPEVVVPAVDRAVTFGSFNHINKMTDQVIDCWSQILARLPDARLMLKTKLLADDDMQEAVCARFEKTGIGRERLILAQATPDYLSVYHDIDIALDPFPRTGGMTTLNALWMGVPVISLVGERFISRQGLSMLKAIGHPEWAVDSVEQYIEQAVALANAPEQRLELRRTQRARIEASPLYDAKGLSQALEQAYRNMWYRYLEGIS